MRDYFKQLFGAGELFNSDTLCNKYLNALIEIRFLKIKDILGEEQINLIIDETTYDLGHHVVGRNCNYFICEKF